MTDSKTKKHLSSKEILQSCQIPGVPAVLQEILNAANDPSLSSVKLEKMILKDAGLSLELLKLVNSSFYALSQKITSVQQAVVLLGLSTVKSIAASLVMLEGFGKMENVEKAYLAIVWRHSILSANLIPVFAAKEPSKRRDELFLAALLHDVGHLILGSHFGNKYRELRKNTDFPKPELEDAKFSVNHADVGAELLMKWMFPEKIVTYVRDHHKDPSISGDPAGLQVIQAADFLSNFLLTTPNPFELEETEIDGELHDKLNKVSWDWNRVLQTKDRLRILAEGGK